MASQVELARCLGVTTRQIRYLQASGTLRKGMTPTEALAAHARVKHRRTKLQSAEAVDKYGFTASEYKILEAALADL